MIVVVSALWRGTSNSTQAPLDEAPAGPIISRMIKNSLARVLVVLGAFVAATLGAGCEGAQAESPEPYQGVVELDEHVLAFEVGGRLREVASVRGAELQPGTPIATLDDSLERPLREARMHDLEAAEAQLSLLRAGARREDVRATGAQLRAARSAEALVTRNLARQQSLAEHGAPAPAAVDQLGGELARAQAERASLEQRLRLLRDGARPEEVATAEARVAGARSALAAADERLTRYSLRANERGRVLDVHVAANEIVAPGAPIVTVADTRRPYVDVFVPQGNVSGIRIGTRATIRVDAERTAHRGRIDDISRRTEFTPRFLFSERERPNIVVRVRVVVDDPGERLHAGVPAFVSFDEAERGTSR